MSSENKPTATLYRASGWSLANGKTTERQPHLFYRAEDIDKLVDDLKAKHKFQMRRQAALEAFYLKELKHEQ